jgi:hypothetical protein
MRKKKSDRQHDLFLRLRGIPDREREEASCILLPIRRERLELQYRETNGVSGRRGKSPQQNLPR